MHTVGSVAYAVSIGYWGVFVQKKERELRREAERRDGKPEKYAKSGDEVYNELLRRHLWCGCCSLAWVHLLMVWLLLACVGASAWTPCLALAGTANTGISHAHWCLRLKFQYTRQRGGMWTR